MTAFFTCCLQSLCMTSFFTCCLQSLCMTFFFTCCFQIQSLCMSAFLMSSPVSLYDCFLHMQFRVVHVLSSRCLLSLCMTVSWLLSSHAVSNPSVWLLSLQCCLQSLCRTAFFTCCLQSLICSLHILSICTTASFACCLPSFSMIAFFTFFLLSLCNFLHIQAVSGLLVRLLSLRVVSSHSAAALLSAWLLSSHAVSILSVQLFPSHVVHLWSVCMTVLFAHVVSCLSARLLSLHAISNLSVQLLPSQVVSSLSVWQFSSNAVSSSDLLLKFSVFFWLLSHTDSILTFLSSLLQSLSLSLSLAFHLPVISLPLSDLHAVFTFCLKSVFCIPTRAVHVCNDYRCVYACLTQLLSNHRHVPLICTPVFVDWRWRVHFYITASY